MAFVLGAACLHLILFAVLSLRLAHPGILEALLAILIMAAAALGAFRSLGSFCILGAWGRAEPTQEEAP